VESCNFNAIEMSHEYELSRYTKDFVLGLDDLLKIGDRYGVHKTGEAWGVTE
jgi:formate hydrogenlyase subunit 6/NADH:ubiquinone oxidoreductase subunit I